MRYEVPGLDGNKIVLLCFLYNRKSLVIQLEGRVISEMETFGGTFMSAVPGSLD